MDSKNESGLAQYLDENTGDLFDNDDEAHLTVKWVDIDGDIATVHVEVETPTETFSTGITVEKTHKTWEVCYLPGGAEHWEDLDVNPTRLENAVAAYVDEHEDGDADSLMDYVEAQRGGVF